MPARSTGAIRSASASSIPGRTERRRSSTTGRRTSRSGRSSSAPPPATLFAAVPSLYRQILKYCDLDAGDLATLRHCLAAGEALSPAILEHWRSATGKEIYEAFGMSECSTFVSNHAGMPIKPGQSRQAAARPVDRASFRTSGPAEPLPAGEVGLLAIHRSDPGLMLGYWRRPDEEDERLSRRLVCRRRPRGLRCGRLSLAPRARRRRHERRRLSRLAARGRGGAPRLSRALPR